MGILTSAAKQVVKSAVKTATTPLVSDALDVSIKALDKASAALEKSIVKKEEKKKKQLLTGNPEANRLLVSVDGKKKRQYIVRDRNGFERYYVKQKTKNMLLFFDHVNNEIGSVKEKMFAIRNPGFHESNPMDFIIEINGKKIGILRTIKSVSKQRFEMDSNKWIVESDFSGKNYKIYNGDKVIAESSSKMRYENCYAVDLYDSKEELLVLMIGLVIDIVSTER